MALTWSREDLIGAMANDLGDRVAYRTETAGLEISRDLDEANGLVASWLEPVLRGEAQGKWNPETRLWEKDT